MGEPGGRQPVSVLYGGAHLYRAGLVAKIGRLALAALDHAPRELGVAEVVDRVRAKLLREPVEDYRIDFEDGYGVRSNDEEDAAAVNAGREFAQGGHPPFIGIRIKPPLQGDPSRGFRTLNLFLEWAGALPDSFVVTLPKVESAAEVERFRKEFPALAIEVMVETPGALAGLEDLIAAAGNALRAIHLGPYDFLSSCGVPGPSQRLGHPLLDHARQVLVLKCAPLGIRVSDGPTSFLPLGAAADITAARRLHRENVLRAVELGIFQGWDLHPAQLAIRYGALCSFFLEHAAGQRVRLENSAANQAQATRVGAAFDDAATVRGLELFFRRGRDCGALEG